jgi:hypothetical protein
MWGNSLGWTISVLIVTFTVSGLGWVNRTLNTISDPTDFSATSGAADAIAAPAPPPGVLPDDSTDGDSVALYHQAIDLYQQNTAEFDRFAEHPNRDELADVEPAVALLRKAMGNTSLGIFAPTPQEAVSYDSQTPLAALKTLGDCTSGAGLLEKIADKKDAAVADFQAAFCLGKRMADERLRYSEFSDGLGLMDGASIELAEIASKDGDAARADALNQFTKSIADYSNQKLVPIQAVLSSIDQDTIEKNAGDVFWLALHSKERMWRVESILTLGRIKYNAGRPGDNRGAARILADIARNDRDAVIKTAATAARDLTLDQYARLH